MSCFTSNQPFLPKKSKVRGLTRRGMLKEREQGDVHPFPPCQVTHRLVKELPAGHLVRTTAPLRRSDISQSTEDRGRPNRPAPLDRSSPQSVPTVETRAAKRSLRGNRWAPVRDGSTTSSRETTSEVRIRWKNRQNRERERNERERERSRNLLSI